jgi:N-acetylglucosamine-6-phosphate deacetylase
MSTIVRRGGYRYPGVIESAFILDLDVEVIADGHHLPIELLRLVYKVKGADKIALVTDSMRAAGMPEGETVIGGKAGGLRAIVEGGVAKLPDRSAFAGSVATADVLVRTMHKRAGVCITDAVDMITKTPARILGLLKKGRIAVGMDCDLVIFDGDIDVKTVVFGGRVVPK